MTHHVGEELSCENLTQWSARVREDGDDAGGAFWGEDLGTLASSDECGTEGVHLRFVHGVHHQGSDEAADKLGEHVEGRLSNRETLEDDLGNCDLRCESICQPCCTKRLQNTTTHSRVEVAARGTGGNNNGKCDAECIGKSNHGQVSLRIASDCREKQCSCGRLAGNAVKPDCNGVSLGLVGLPSARPWLAHLPQPRQREHRSSRVDSAPTYDGACCRPDRKRGRPGAGHRCDPRQSRSHQAL